MTDNILIKRSDLNELGEVLNKLQRIYPGHRTELEMLIHDAVGQLETIYAQHDPNQDFIDWAKGEGIHQDYIESIAYLNEDENT